MVYRPWWQAPPLPAAQAQHLAGEAQGAWVFTHGVIPGPLQTPEYAHAVITAAAHLAGLPAHDVAATVEARLARARAMREQPEGWRFLLGAAALRGGVGSAALMAAQRKAVLEAVQALPVGAFGVIPDALRDAAAGLVNFTMLPAGLVLVETPAGEITHDDAEHLACYQRIWARLTPCAVYGVDAERLIRSGNLI